MPSRQHEVPSSLDSVTNDTVVEHERAREHVHSPRPLACRLANRTQLKITSRGALVRVLLLASRWRSIRTQPSTAQYHGSREVPVPVVPRSPLQLLCFRLHALANGPALLHICPRRVGSEDSGSGRRLHNWGAEPHAQSSNYTTVHALYLSTVTPEEA